MSAVEELREAARLLRERAEKATPGPWRANNAKKGSALNWVVDGDIRPADHAWVAMMMFGDDCEADARYIASMHPLVGLALADWLDRAAQCLGTSEYLDWGALHVARAYLGTGGDSRG